MATRAVTAKTAAKTDRALAAVQLSKTDKDALSDSTVEGEVVGQKEYDIVKLKDKDFRIAESIGAMPMLKWAAAADMSTEDPRALAAIYAMLQDVILKDDWNSFERHAMDEKAEAEDLLQVVTDGLEIISARPTEQPSSS